MGRNGNPGEYIGIFNKEIVGEDIDAYMEKVAEQERVLRSQSQPFTDILEPFNVINQDQEANAIITIDNIKKMWKKLLKENNGKKNPIELNKDLFKNVIKIYPNAEKPIKDYLVRSSSNVPEINKVHELSAKKDYQISYVIQRYTESKYVPQESQFSWIRIGTLARTLSDIYKPESFKNSNFYQKAFYSGFYQAQNIIVTTHALDIKEHKFALSNIFHYELKKFSSVNSLILTEPNDMGVENSDVSIKISISRDKLSCKYKEKNPVKIKIEDIGLQLHNKILKTLQDNSLNDLKLNSKELAALDKFFIGKNLLTPTVIDGEGALGNLMLNEFKKSFQMYQNAVYKVPPPKVKFCTKFVIPAEAGIHVILCTNLRSISKRIT